MKPDVASSRGLEVPRRAAVLVGLFVWLVVLPLAHGLLPWALSRLASRHGWAGGQPAWWNLLALMPVALGLGGLAWVFVEGFSRIGAMPARVRLGFAPVILLTRGPFAFSRNPMYLSALTLWLGWTFFYGSLVLAAVWPGLGAVLCLVVVPREERSLERCFGEVYRRYRQDTPRWFGKRRRRGTTRLGDSVSPGRETHL
jgi:protein-S-isoprenylcysteine O-methyltransferase Ste14